MWVRRGLDPILGALDGVRVEWRDRRWSRIEVCPRPPADFSPAECFADWLLTPGLLNAHTHLDYAFLDGRLGRPTGFADWLRCMIRARRDDEAAAAAAVGAVRSAAARRALEQCLSEGVTTLWDIHSFGWGREALKGSLVEAISFDEWIAPTAAHWETTRETLMRDSGSARRGISPHAPYSICPKALAESAAWARERRLPLAIHLAESPDERRLLVTGDGPLCELLREVSGADPTVELGVGPGAIARVETAGLLTPATLAIHCNLPEPGDAERLARTGAVVVYCPESHRFFGYPPYPLATYRRAGVRLALGTDSLASNARLSLRGELRALLEDHRDVAPAEALALATGAALGDDAPLGGRGRLENGFPAQWALWDSGGPSSSARLDELFHAWLKPKTRCIRSSAWDGLPATNAAARDEQPS
jgi:cytosine/adenosine deaminase-related metal-dependent hydrolase